VFPVCQIRRKFLSIRPAGLTDGAPIAQLLEYCCNAAQSASDLYRISLSRHRYAVSYSGIDWINSFMGTTRIIELGLDQWERIKLLVLDNL